jgi:hypothetical protein
MLQLRDLVFDLNNDERVDNADLVLLLSAWYSSPAGDVDGDADTDTLDLQMMLNALGNQVVCP